MTFGCANNKAESEIMMGLLEKAGHRIVKEGEGLLVINSCAVKGPTENRALEKIKNYEKLLVVAGCLPEYAPEKVRKANPQAVLLGTNRFNRIVEAVEEGKDFLGYAKTVRAGHPRVRINKKVGVVPISSGCLGDCAYCCVKNIKKTFHSFPEKTVLEEVEKSLREGVNEIWITSQDNGCYGHDSGTSIVELLKKIILVPGNFKVRVGMMNPQWAGKYLKNLIQVFKSPKIMKFVHVPVQSGSDKILKAMNRQYSVKDFVEVVETFRKEVPGVSVSTDVIVGFPGETEKDFEQTYELVKKINPEVLNLSKFWVRKGTRAEGMEQVLRKIIKKRSRKIFRLIKTA